MIEVILQLVFGLVELFICALVGVLWPPQSPTWARWRKIGIALGLAAAMTFALGFVVESQFGPIDQLSWIFGLAIILAVCYMIVGNGCRAMHASAKRDAAATVR